MRHVSKCVLGVCVGVAGLGLLAGRADAQFKNGSQPTELNIPRVSQRASVTQRIGLTTMELSGVLHQRSVLISAPRIPPPGPARQRPSFN
jgi:hypothetical protein